MSGRCIAKPLGHWQRHKLLERRFDFRIRTIAAALFWLTSLPFQKKFA